MAGYYFVLFLATLGCTMGLDSNSTKNSNEKIPQFRNDYIYISTYDSFYKFHYLRKNFTEAMLTCMDEGSSLLTPTSKLEVIEVTNKTSKIPVATQWIGIHNIFHDDVFYSSEGNNFNELFSEAVDKKIKKKYRFPLYQQKRCLFMYDKHYINIGDYSNDLDNIIYESQDCDQELQYICKKKAKIVEYNKECDKYDMSYVRAPTNDTCYKLHTLQRSWFEAFKVCILEQSQLVEINSKTEADYLIKYIFKMPKNETTSQFIHVGFSDLFIDGVFMTNSGKFLSGYEQWKNGSITTKGPCGAFYIKGGLMTTDCHVKAMFFCEKEINKPTNFYNSKSLQ